MSSWSYEGNVTRRLGATALLLACLLAGRDGRCQSNDERTFARAAAAEGAKAFSEKRWADAIDLFKRAESMVHAPPHLLYIARAQVETGRLVEARENYLTLVHEDLKPDAPQVFRSAKDSAGEELKAVEARLAYVTLVLKGANASDVSLTQDGGKIPSAMVGIARPVNPGAHTFEGSGKGLGGTASITLKEGERQRLTLELTASGAGAAPVPVVAPVAAPVEHPAASPATPATSPPPDSGTNPPPSADTGGSKMSGLFIGSMAAFGVGAAGIAVGTIFTLGGASKQSDSDKVFNDHDCGKNACLAYRSQISDLDDQANSKKTIGVIGFVAGGVGVAAGVTLLVLNGHKHTESAGGLPTTMAVAVGPSSVRLSGTF
jgi:hypothetical protein